MPTDAQHESDETGQAPRLQDIVQPARFQITTIAPPTAATEVAMLDLLITVLQMMTASTPNLDGGGPPPYPR